MLYISPPKTLPLQSSPPGTNVGSCASFHFRVHYGKGIGGVNEYQIAKAFQELSCGICAVGCHPLRLERALV